MEYAIIQHRNPQGRVTWYRSVYVNDKGQKVFSSRYGKGCLRLAQNWLYANIHIWCKVVNKEQRIVDADGRSKIIQLGQEQIG